MEPVAFGELRLATPLLLSPLAGYTNLPFRRVIREIGGVGLCTTDLVNARSLLEKNRKALKLIETCAEDFPLAVQIFGSVPSEMTAAARVLEELGVASVDVNMGCPVKKVCGVGGGSAMMTELDRTATLVRGMVEAVKIPVTCKMRLGWDDDNLTAPDLARALEDVGVAALMVHGRTRQPCAAFRSSATAISPVPSPPGLCWRRPDVPESASGAALSIIHGFSPTRSVFWKRAWSLPSRRLPSAFA
jgi:tRNA-dihydrouridine synthase B